MVNLFDRNILFISCPELLDFIDIIIPTIIEIMTINPIVKVKAMHLFLLVPLFTLIFGIFIVCGIDTNSCSPVISPKLMVCVDALTK